jgi:hypothetical protein
MVTITSDLAIAEHPTLFVYSPAGEYADADLILCADRSDPATPVAMLQAQFIKYGSMVYQFNTPEDLGKAILAIDANSKLDAVVLYQQAEARDAARAAGTLTPSDALVAKPTPVVPDSATATPDTSATSTPDTTAPTTTGDSSAASVIAQDQKIIDENTKILDALGTTTPSVVSDMSTTTPATLPTTPVVATTTPVIPDTLPIDVPSATSTATSTP